MTSSLHARAHTQPYRALTQLPGLPKAGYDVPLSYRVCAAVHATETVPECTASHRLRCLPIQLRDRTLMSVIT